MKKVFVSIVISIVISSVAFAQDVQDDFYVKIGIGNNTGIDDKAFYKINSAATSTNFFDFDFGESTAYQIGVGYIVNDWFSAEFSLHHNSGFDLEGPRIFNGHSTLYAGQVNLTTTSAILSGQIDMASILKKEWKIRPYLGLGVGYAKNKLRELSFHYKDSGQDTGLHMYSNVENDFTWKAILGVTYPLNEHFIFDVSYMYADYGEAKSGSSLNNGLTIAEPASFDVRAHEFLLSVKYFF